MPLLLPRPPVHVFSTNGAVQWHLRLSVGVGIAEVGPGRPHIGTVARVIWGGTAAHHTVLALTRGGHMVTCVGKGELSLEGSVFWSRVATAVVVVHVWLLIGVLHAIHVTLMSLGWGAVHTVHWTLVAVLKSSDGRRYCFRHTQNTQHHQCDIM